MSGHTKRSIYFCGSIRGGREDAALYRRIIDQLKEYGDVLTEHIADADVLDKDQGLRPSSYNCSLVQNLISLSLQAVNIFTLVVIYKLFLVYLAPCYSYVRR